MHAKGIDAKGVETERKDTLPFTKEIMYVVRDALMEEVDDELALKRFKEKLDELVNDKVPMEKLVLRKNLSGKVAHKTSQIAHARVNALKREREAGSESAVNEQVEYVIVNGHKKQKTTELAEDPAYAKEHGLKLNRLWYFEHCIEEALRKVFAACDEIDYEAVCREYKGKLNSARLGANTNLMMSLLKPRAPPKKKGEEGTSNGAGTSSHP
jgi:DNA polymerase elongation subunit (family B)